jgi:hypothetical protein
MGFPGRTRFSAHHACAADTSGKPRAFAGVEIPLLDTKRLPANVDRRRELTGAGSA